MTDTLLAAQILPLLTAPFIGSFLGVLIIRLPAGAPIVFARSSCPRCGTRLSPIDLVPLVSFLLLRGRCRHCGGRIGLFCPTVEMAAVAVAAWATLTRMDPEQVWAACGLGWTLLVLAWIDWTHLLLPDALTLPLLLAGLAVTSLWQPEMLAGHCIAAILGYLAFQLLATLYRRLRGHDGLGGGDAKLLAAAGAWCGPAALPFIVLAGALFGLLAALGLALSRGNMTSRTQIPFGPCIALAFWLAWLHGGLVEDLAQVLGRSR